MAKVKLEPFEACSLFHGTTARHANRIIEHGSSDYLGMIGAPQVAVELWRRLITHHSGADAAVARLQALDCTFSTSIPIAIGSITGEARAPYFEYGDLYVTLGLQRAARYALRSQCGSELLGMIADLIKAVRADGDNIDALLSSFPELAIAVLVPTPPIVIEFSGIHLDQVADGHGIIDLDWISKAVDLLNILHPSDGGTYFDLRLKTFRINNVVRFYRLDQLTQSDAKLAQRTAMGDDELESRIRLTASSVKRIGVQPQHNV